MSAADNLARQDEADDYRALQAVRDSQYLEACEAAGVEPLPNHPKQLAVNVVLPAVDRGTRNGSHLIDETGESDSDQEEQGAESSDDEIERAIKSAGEVLDRKFVQFLIRGKKGARIASRLAAIGIMSRRFKPKDIPKVFDPKEVTPARLRLATAELQEFLAQDEGGAE